jgi:hypothetical protein
MLAIAIAVIMLFGAIFGGKDRWSILLVGAAALVAVASVTETQRTRKANEAMVIENQATRKVMAETLIENQQMRRFIERARFEEIKPRLVIDMAEYHDKGDRGLRLVFHNEGRGVAILRDVTLTEHLILKDDPPTERDIVLQHTFPEIVIRPHQSSYTNIRNASYGDLMIAFVAKATFVARAKVCNVNDEHVSDYERPFEGGLSDWYVETDHGTECGEWLNEDGSGVGAIA